MASVDVVIPSHNRADLTEQAVASVLAQTFTDLHVWVVDDGSERAAYEQHRQLEGERVTVVRNDAPRGEAGARHTGYEASSAPYVALLDNDDVWLPRKLELQMAMAADDECVVLCGHRWDRLGGAQGADQFPSSSPVIPTTNMSMPLISRSLLDRLGGFAPDGHPRLRFGVNIDFWLRLVALRPDMRLVREVLAVCRHHEQERVSDAIHDEGGASAFAYLLREHGELLKGDPRYRAELLYRCAIMHLGLGRRREGIGYLSRVPASGRGALQPSRKYGPAAVKQLVVGGRAKAAG